MKRFKNILFIADCGDGLQAAFELRRHTGGGPGRDDTLGRADAPGLIIGNTAEDVLRETLTAVLAVKSSDSVSPVVQ